MKNLIAIISQAMMMRLIWNYTCLFKKLHKFRTKTEIKIRVYQGAKEFGNQIIPFRLACNIISSTASFEVVHLTTSDVNKHQLSEMDIIDWLLEGDIHFILTHIHQGIVNINMNKLYSSISKLHDHPGFPSCIDNFLMAWRRWWFVFGWKISYP